MFEKQQVDDTYNENNINCNHGVKNGDVKTLFSYAANFKNISRHDNIFTCHSRFPNIEIQSLNRRFVSQHIIGIYTHSSPFNNYALEKIQFTNS